MREILVCLACGVDTDCCNCTGTRSSLVVAAALLPMAGGEAPALQMPRSHDGLGEQTGAGKQTDRFAQPKATAREETPSQVRHEK
jgi:hypothetical protein